VWIAPVPDKTGALESILTTLERARAREFRQRADASRFVTGRALLRLALATVLDSAACEVAIDCRCPRCGKPHGAPRLLGPAHAGTSVSVTHSGTLVAVAVNRQGPVGVDVEEVRPLSVAEMSPLVLTEAELRELALIDEEVRAQVLLACWSRKESYLKAIGSGLTIDMRELCVTLLPSDPPRIRSTPDGTPPESWAVHALELGPGFVGAVVARPVVGLLRFDLSTADLLRAAATGRISCRPGPSSGAGG